MANQHLLPRCEDSVRVLRQILSAIKSMLDANEVYMAYVQDKLLAFTSTVGIDAHYS